MRKFVILNLMVVILMLCFVTSALAEGEAGAFLRIGAGARALGMGGTFVAIADDSTAAYWNPAGLAQLEKMEISSLYSDQFGLGISYSFLNYAHPLPDSAAAISWVRLSVGDIPIVTKQGDRPVVVGYFEDSENAILLSYGRNLTSDIMLGATVKGVFQSLEKHSASGFGLDVGVLYKTPVEDLMVGATLLDIGTSLNWDTDHTDSFPLRTKLGVSYKLLEDQLILGADYEMGGIEDKLHLGAEYWYEGMFAVRAGLDGDNLTAGAGIRYGVSNTDLGFDYAFLSHELGNTHRLSLIARF